MDKHDYQTRKRPYSKYQKGATLIETMVSLFVMGIGLFGFLALQVKGINSTQRAHFSTDANMLADDMASRIQGYVRNLNIEEMQNSDVLDDYHGIDSRNSNATKPNCLHVGCNEILQKQLDEWEWITQIKNRLPEGIGLVDYSAGTYEITIMWNQDQIENPTANCTGSATDYACFVYTLKLE